MIIFFIVLGIFSISITLLPFIKSDRWWIRIFDYPRSQAMGLSLISLAGIFYFEPIDNYWEYILIVLLLLSLVYQSLIILPYTSIRPVQVKRSKGANKDDPISLLVANVLLQNKNSEKLLEIIKHCDPDVILAVETDRWWQSELDELKVIYKTIISYPLDNTYGMLLYSKLELLDSKIRFLVDEEIPSIYTKVKLRNGKIVEVYGLHPTPPVPGENDSSTERDAELLIVGKEANKSDLPVIVAGDLNDVAWSYTTKLFQKISGLLDPRIGRGLFNTFNAKYPLLRWPLDHVFHSIHFKVIKLERLPFFNSDHFPIFIHLFLDPLASLSQEEPHSDKDEKLEAEEKIEKV
ncbi:MAG: endonuclease/exonuclease/phosphatase family protein [Bacteroidota bacterium]|nr:endonuclease/exonuclease/phosphatase family protein [Bacteroidota bacterium]